MDGKKRGRQLSPWRLLLFVLVLLLIAGGTSLFFGQRSPEASTAIERYRTYLDEKQIKQARSVYFEELFGDVELQAEAERIALEALEAIQDDFHAVRINYERAEGAIRALEQSGIFIPTNKITEAYERINLDNRSKLQYEAGRVAWGAGEYLAAAQAYRFVDPSDPYYDVAREGLRRSLAAYRDAVIEEAAALVEEGEYLGSVSILEAALKELPEDEKLVDAYGKTLYRADDRYRQFMMEQARLAEDAGNMVFSLHILDTAISYLEELAELDISQLEDHVLRQANIQTDIRLLRAEAARLRANILNEAAERIDRLLAGRSYAAALAVLDEALDLLPDAARLLTKQEEIERALNYTFDTYMKAGPELLALDPGLALMSEWRANFGDAVVEIFPAPPSFPEERIELWWLQPGANRFQSRLVLEYNEDILNSLDLDPDLLRMFVELRSGDITETVELALNDPAYTLDSRIERSKLFSMTARLTYAGEALPEEILTSIRTQHAVRLFLTESSFYHEGSFDALADYRSYMKALEERKENAINARWKTLVELDLEEPSDEGSAGEETLEPLRIPNVRDTEGNRYREPYLISQDTRLGLTWKTESSFKRIRGSVAWLDEGSLSQGFMNQLFLDGGEALLAREENHQDLQILLLSGNRPLLALNLNEAKDEESFHLDLPFIADELTVKLVNRNTKNEAWAFILDLEVSP